ncbi:hypothetical protein [Cellulosilyticum sp. I15G10I2]|uniref:hypothetical protein n=1 Tax=Cellulosilyticum sp. I15G10I2 TaxID=1892843 RepID=UPI00085BF312|nr:hypothetical protein [Cellulosilyticum sp. I15G10I2]
MKMKKFLATILIASSAFLGTGYAWWMDGLEIKGVVSTGQFNVVGVEGKITTTGRSGKTEDMKDYESSNITGYTYSISDLYPYKPYYFTAKFENQGSIPAKVATINIIKSNEMTIDEANVFDYLQVTGTVKIIDEKDRQASGGINGSEEEYKYIITKGQNVTISNLEQHLNQVINWRLEPGHKIIFEDFKVRLVGVKYDKQTSKNMFEESNVQFDLQILFEQHNQVAEYK